MTSGGQAPGSAPELRRCIRDLVALSTLSALWTHADPAEIADGLGDALLAILGCEFVHIRMLGPSPPASIVDHACARGLRREQALATLGPLLQPYLTSDVGSADVPELQLPGGRSLRIAVHWFGHDAFSGILIAGSARQDFPSELDRLVLGVGVNQATTTLQRHQAESHRRDTERRFQQFMENVPGLAWIKDEHGRFLYVNESGAAAFGKPRRELIGLTDAEVLPPTTAAACIESDSQVARTRAPHQALEAFHTTEGKVRHMLVTKFPIPAADSDAALLGGIAIDATDRIAAEDALRESDRRKDEFLAMLAHELRNPLAPVRNAAQILKLKSGHLPEIAWAAEMIERQTTHMTRLVDDLLDVSRITRGAIHLRKERLVLQDVSHAALESVRPMLDAAAHEVEVALPATPIVVDGDATRLAQVLANLLNNAAKYTPRGGKIRLEASRRGGLAEIRVADNGIGIPTDMLGRVFDLFVQVDNSIQRAQSGLGIGLTMVKRLVELHGGSVVAESAGAGAGSTFTVRLPLAIPAAAEPAEPVPHASPNGLRRRVLVVDDNRDAAASLGALLEHSGCVVRLAFEGVEAIGAFSLFVPDLVILDIGLPKMSGYEVVRHLRAQHPGRDVAFIALTGFGKEDDRAAALAAGFDHHLTKPVAYDTLRELMAQLEWRRRRERGLVQNGA